MLRLSALLLTACASMPVAEVPELHSVAAESTVILVVNNVPRCAAVAVGPGELLTTYHCLGGSDSAGYVDRKAWKFGWHTEVAKLAKWSEAEDLAILTTRKRLDYWTPTSAVPISDGDNVCWSHHGNRWPYQWDCGEVTRASDTTQNDQKLFLKITETSLTATNGDSGSGLWNQAGQLVGICESQRESNGRALFVTGAAIVALLWS